MEGADISAGAGVGGVFDGGLGVEREYRDAGNGDPGHCSSPGFPEGGLYCSVCDATACEKICEEIGQGQVLHYDKMDIGGKGPNGPIERLRVFSDIFVGSKRWSLGVLG